MHDDDTIALILLRTGLALPARSAVEPFRSRDWEKNGIGERLTQRGVREGCLLGKSATDIGREFDLSLDVAERISQLASRGAQLALERDRLQSRGIWIITRYDDDFPALLDRRLGASTPPVLFGAGAKELLSRRCVAVVGSRDVDAGGFAFTERVGRAAANVGLTICSGGARGVDRAATQTTLDAGGTAVSVLAEGVERPIRTKDNVKPLLEGTLVMVRPYLPKAGFTVGNAMGRNRIVYCLSEAAIVVSSAERSGGTWSGAVENLNATWKIPLYVRVGSGVPAGNQALVANGAQPVTGDAVEELIQRIERSEMPEIVTGRADAQSTILHADSTSVAAPDSGISLFDSVWPHFAKALEAPKTEAELAAAFPDLLHSQLKKWLKQAVERGLVSADGHPKRYRALESDPIRSGQTSLPLFG